MRLLAISGLALLVGCDGGDILIAGTEVYSMFPFDGDRRTWEYLNDKAPYFLHANTVGDPERQDGTNVYAVSYWKSCRQQNDPDCNNEEEILNIRWSSDSLDGVLIHAYTSGNTGVALDPPVQFARDRMNAGEQTITNSGGVEWIATYEGIDACPTTRNEAQWTQCGRFRLEAPKAANQGVPLAGTYWALPGRNVVGIDWLDSEYGLWQHKRDSCEPQGSCDGRW